MELFSENYLSHHGIQGQKWGVRRFQNEDGTYTEAGKERYFGPERRVRVLKDDINGAKRRVYQMRQTKQVLTDDPDKAQENFEKNSKRIDALNSDPDDYKSLDDYENNFIENYNELDKYSDISSKAFDKFVTEGQKATFDYLEEALKEDLFMYDLLEAEYTDVGASEVYTTLKILGKNGYVEFQNDGYAVKGIPYNAGGETSWHTYDEDKKKK